jgi:hypothetical protein
MKKLSIASILLTLAVPLAAQSVSFNSSDVAAGQSWTEDGNYSSTMTTTVFDSTRTLPAATQSHATTRSKNVKLTDVGGDDRINALEVTYTSASEPSVAGHTYAVSVSGNGVDVGYSSGGGSPSAAEVAFVKADNAHFGQFRSLNRLFGGKTITIGSAVSPINKTDASELIDATDMSLDSIDLALQGVSGAGADRIAVFTGTLTLRGSMKSNAKSSDKTADDEKFSGDLRTTMNVTLKVRAATCRPVELQLDGSTTINATRSAKGSASHGRDKMTVSGDGSSSLRLNYSF